VVGVIYSPNHQTSRLVVADCCMVHRTVRCTPDMSGAPATSPGRWVPTVGALSSGPAWMSGGTPGMYCRVSGVPARACLTSACFWRALNAPAGDHWREVVIALLVHRTVRCTPDSPVNYSGVNSCHTRFLEGKPNANHVRARISYSRTQQLHNMDIITQCSK
jgi:hypothetical protein